MTHASNDLNGQAQPLTNFPHTPGVVTPEQQTHLERVSKWAPRWFNWHPDIANPDGSSAGKVPLNPLSWRQGKVNDPTTAGTLAQALANIHKGGGVGVLMLNADLQLIALDFDHVVNADGTFTALGQLVFDNFRNTYIELSPSGTGLRIFCFGKVNIKNQRKNGVELYPAGTGRWLRVTGSILASTVGEVRDCQGGIDWAVSVMLGETAEAAEAPAAPATTPRPVSIDNLTADLTADQIFDRLAGFRGEWSKTIGEAKSSIEKTIREHPDRALAKAIDALRSGDEKSENDFSIMCEVYRRGLDGLDDGAEILLVLAGKGAREKLTTRKDYRRDTAKEAARTVLKELEGGNINRTHFRYWQHLPGPKAHQPKPLPKELTEPLKESRDQLIMRGDKIEETPGNVKIILTNDTRVNSMLAFNESSQNVERTGAWTVFDRHATGKLGVLQDIDIDFVGAWLHRSHGIKLRKTEVMQGLEMAARANSYDPVGDSLHHLNAQWDGVERAATWLQDFAMVDDQGCREYVSAAGLCFLVGAVSRALDPGCKHDTVLTMEGAGGGGKSTLFQIMSDAVGQDLFTDGCADVTNPTHRTEVTEGKFIVEIAELAGFRRAADQESLKTVLSQQRDKVRKPYAIRPVEILRRYVFVATTNNDQYLADPTGAMARRFMPVRTTATETNPIDRDALREAAGQLWGEAVSLYLKGAPTYIDPKSKAWSQWNAQRNQRQETLPFDDEVNDLMMRVSDGEQNRYDIEYGITRKDAAREIGLDDFAQADQRTMDRLTGTMKAKGFIRQPKYAGTYPWKLNAAGFAAGRKMIEERKQLAKK